MAEPGREPDVAPAIRRWSPAPDTDTSDTPSGHRLVVCLGTSKRSSWDGSALQVGRIVLLDEAADAIVWVRGANGLHTGAQLRRDERGYLLQFAEVDSP